MVSLKEFVYGNEKGPGGVKIEAIRRETWVSTPEQEKDTERPKINLADLVVPCHGTGKTPVILLTG